MRVPELDVIPLFSNRAPGRPWVNTLRKNGGRAPDVDVNTFAADMGGRSDSDAIAPRSKGDRSLEPVGRAISSRRSTSPTPF